MFSWAFIDAIYVVREFHAKAYRPYNVSRSPSFFGRNVIADPASRRSVLW